MIAQARFKSVHWMLLAVIALAPTAVLAQQDNASQDQNQKQTEAAQARQKQQREKPKDACTDGSGTKTD